MRPFTLSRLPELVFGEGRLFDLPSILKNRGLRSAALLTGGKSFRLGEAYGRLRRELDLAGVGVLEFSVSGEPSPELVDGVTAELRDARGTRPDAVVAIGGGSVIDAAKAVAAMMTMDGGIADYLEGVGTRVPSGARLPLIAVPTTSGTGSEATKNAVISRVGRDGFKKSLRHDNYAPDTAVVDPLLVLSCPRDVSAASGLDAVTQLLEAYTSIRSTPFTDALALPALRTAGLCFPRVLKDGGDREARAGMAYAAYVSGVCLAHAGLGVVHGIASPLGGMFDVPHGVVCGSLVAEATRYTVARAMKIDDESEDSALRKYARAGAALSGSDAGSDIGNAALLVKTLEALIASAGLPKLGGYGVTEADARLVAEKTDAKSHPIPLSSDDVFAILRERL